MRFFRAQRVVVATQLAKMEQAHTHTTSHISNGASNIPWMFKLTENLSPTNGVEQFPFYL